MAAKGDESCNWIWEYFSRTENKVQCKICNRTFGNTRNEKITWMTHLHHKHGIHNEEDKSRWENDNDLIWQYFDKPKLYVAKCTLCNKSIRRAHKPYLKRHIKKVHLEKIISVIQEEIANNSLSKHFTTNMEHFIARCKYCNYTTDIFYKDRGINNLKSHYQSHITNESSKFQEETKDKHESTNKYSSFSKSR